MSEQEAVLNSIRAMLAARGLEALLLQRVSSFAWATCGADSHINTASSFGEAAALITPQACTLITNNIEAPRLEQEEGLAAQGWQLEVAPWHASANDATDRLTRGLKLGADSAYPGAVDVSAEVSDLRSVLTPEAAERFRGLGRVCGESMQAAILAVRPGQSEYELAGRLAQEAQSRGAQPIVVLVACDARIFNYRHPLPTANKLERYAMLILCGRRSGLVASITRLVHFGPLPDELKHKAQACAEVDAAYIAATRPGNNLDDVLQAGVAAYAQAGYPDEWQLHHQGGPAGYEPRERLATPGDTFAVRVNQAYAWNPSITGVKSEDTILVTAGGPNEELTAIPGWPVLTAAGMLRPAILER